MFPSLEYWSGVPFPTPGDFPDIGMEPTSLVSPALSDRFLYHSHHLQSPMTSKVYVRAYLLNHVRLFVTPWTAVHQVLLSMGILQARILE